MANERLTQAGIDNLMRLCNLASGRDLNEEGPNLPGVITEVYEIATKSFTKEQIESPTILTQMEPEDLSRIQNALLGNTVNMVFRRLTRG